MKDPIQPLIRSSFGALALAGAAVAQPQVGTPPLGHPVRIMPTSTEKAVVANVYSGRYSWVRIEAREAGAAPNQHPVQLGAAELRALLAQVQWVDNPSEPMFSTRQLDEISAPVAAALGRAGAEQDVSFAVSDQFGLTGALAGRSVTTARLFRQDDRLQLIVGLGRRDFESQFRGTGTLIAFEPGQRGQIVDRQFKLALAADAGRLVRADWVALTLGREAALAAVPASAPAAVAAPPPTAAPKGTDASVAPPAAQPIRPAAPAAPSRGAEELYRSVAERLRALDKLRGDGLITEAEYQDKRKQLLRDL
jgi:hypothetical protein